FSLIEVHESQSLYVLQDVNGLEQSAAPRIWQIDLRYVSRNYRLRVESQTRHKHFHLLRSGVLGFIQNHKRIVQSTPPHEGNGSNLDDILFQIAIHFFGVEHVIEGVVQRTQVGIDFVLQRTGQESQSLACFDRWTGQNDSVHPLCQQRRNRHRDSQI